MSDKLPLGEIIVTESVYGHDIIHEIISLAVGRSGRPDGLALLDLPASHALSDGAGVKIALLCGDVDYLSTVSYNWSHQLWEAGTTDGLPTDVHGLGTALLMLMASDGTGGMPVGVAPGADYRVYPVLDNGGTVLEAEAVEAVNKACVWGADVIVIPWTHWVPSRSLARAVSKAVRAGVMVFCPVPTVCGDRSHETHFDEIEEVITVGRPSTSVSRPPALAVHGGAVLFGPVRPCIAGGTCHRLVSVSGPAVAACTVAGLYALLLGAVKKREKPSHHRISAMLQMMLCDTIAASGTRLFPGGCGVPDILPCLKLIGEIGADATGLVPSPFDAEDLRHEITTRLA